MDLCYPMMGFNRVVTFLLLYLSLFGRINGGSNDYKPGNCREVYELGDTGTGEKVLYTASGRPFKFYCHFGGQILGLLHKDIFFDNSDIDLDVTKLYDHMEVPMIAFFHKVDHKLFYVRAGRMDHRSSSKRPVIMWNIHHGFKAPSTTDTNYLFLGFYDQQEAAQNGSVQGIHVIGGNKDFSYVRCNQDARSYIVFLGEKGNAESKNSCCGFTSNVLTQARHIAIHVAEQDYSLFGKIDFGGCGAHHTSDLMSNYDGMNFVFTSFYDTCSDPGKHIQTERSGDIFTKGSTVTYSCVAGTKYNSGDWSITCMGYTGWSGQPLVCMLPGSCREAYDLGSTESGEIILLTASGKEFKMYCHFGNEQIYSLLHKDIFENTDIDLDVTKLYDHMEGAMIGFFEKDTHGLYQVMVGRLDHRYSETRPVIMWNNHLGFQAPYTMRTKYLFLGFYDKQEAAQIGTFQGIHVISDNRNCSFVKPDPNPYSYIAFYGDKSIGEYRTHEGILPCILATARLSAIDVPEADYSLLGSIQFSGYGVHVTSNQMTDYDGMNFIFTYSYDTCSDPGKHIHTERSGDNFTNGRTVNYSCATGTKYISGDQSITCMGKIGWSGQPLVCMPPSNCREVYDLGFTDSGEKVLYTASGKQFKFYCHFGDDKIYGLLHKDIFFDGSDIDLDVTKLYDHMEGAMIGLFDETSHELYQVEAGRLDHTSSNKTPVIMWNNHHGFKAPTTTDTKYLFIGFYDKWEAARRSLQGIHIIKKNKDCHYTNCNGDSYSYITFYGETKGSFNNPGFDSCIPGSAVSTQIIPPEDDYSLFGEMRFGGCGTHLTSDNINYYDGMNFIFTYHYAPCIDPGTHNHTERTGDILTKGSTVNYSCVDGSERTSGDWSITCMGYTGWSGQPLVCMPSKYYTAQPFNIKPSYV